MGEANSVQDTCLDLSVKDFWVIVQYKDCDPGNEFEILNENQIVSESWITLEQGAEVTVRFGNARVQALVVMVSDELETLQETIMALREEYNAKLKGRKAVTQLIDSFERKGIRQHVIKVKDKSTQTEDDALLKKLGLEKKMFENKFNKLLKAYQNLRENVQSALNNAESWQGKSNSQHSDVDSSPENLRRNVLQPMKNVNSLDFNETDNAIIEGDMVYIGTHQTAVPKLMYDAVNWLSPSAATRKLLVAVFPRKMLATHSLTGKPSPAFLGSDKQIKMKLDPLKISDIVEVVSAKCKVSESLVRSAITTKCADENKMYRKRMEKRLALENNENRPCKNAKTK